MMYRLVRELAVDGIPFDGDVLGAEDRSPAVLPPSEVPTNLSVDADDRMCLLAPEQFVRRQLADSHREPADPVGVADPRARPCDAYLLLRRTPLAERGGDRSGAWSLSRIAL